MSVADHFTGSGKSLDEIVLTFRDGRKLYVSESLLRYASPVFETMFEQKFRESEKREIDMTDKSYADYLELLLCLHPGKQKPVDEKNVLCLVSLAHKYQMDSLLDRCKDEMKRKLCDLEDGKDKVSVHEHYRIAGDCLKILIKAKEIQLEDLCTAAIQVIGQFGYRVIIGLQSPIFGQGKTPLRSFSELANTSTEATNCVTTDKEVSPENVVEEEDDPITECKRLFDSIPDKLKIKILLERLSVCDREQQ